MNILILNWRDPKNPRSGGAEILNMHILKPFLDLNNMITWYSMSVPSLPEFEEYSGLNIIRRGNLLTHFILWPYYYYRGLLGKPNIIIDCVHGTAYWAGLIAPSKKVIVLICEVAQNIWDEMWPFPVNIIGRIYEWFMYRLYPGKYFWTISDSTKKDLIKFGVKRSKISVLPMGYEAVKLPRPIVKAPVPTALFVGRLCAMKGVKDAITAVANTENWHLVIVGRGELEYEKELKQMVNRLNMQNRVTFKGFVSQKEKFELYASSWVLLVPSKREGWGMTVPEANSVGTPVIGYNVSGLRDVLRLSSTANKLVDPNAIALTEVLITLNKPAFASIVNIPGWSDLEKYVINQIKILQL